MKFIRNLQDAESREFWEAIDQGAREVAAWPDWKRRMVAGEREDMQSQSEAVTDADKEP